MDHKPLTFPVRRKPDKANLRQLRHLTFINQFISDIQGVLGKDNLDADALFRISEVNVPGAVDFSAIIAAQKSDAVPQKSAAGPQIHIQGVPYLRLVFLYLL